MESMDAGSIAVGDTINFWVESLLGNAWRMLRNSAGCFLFLFCPQIRKSNVQAAGALGDLIFVV